MTVLRFLAASFRVAANLLDGGTTSTSAAPAAPWPKLTQGIWCTSETPAVAAPAADSSEPSHLLKVIGFRSGRPKTQLPVWMDVVAKKSLTVSSTATAVSLASLDSKARAVVDLSEFMAFQTNAMVGGRDISLPRLTFGV
jgi:hypothetical protein